MRRLVICILSFVICSLIASLRGQADDRPLPEKFGQAMCHIRFLTYVDHDFGYSFSYPSIFSREDDETYGVGHVQWGYHVLTDMILECNVLPESSIHHKDSDFVLSGFTDRDAAYRYDRHYVRRGHLWYVLTFVYPTEFHDAVHSIRYKVCTWQPFADAGILKPLRHGRQQPPR